MSDFPNPQSYRRSISESHFRFLDSFLPDSFHFFVLKKEKNQYLYDIDGNKYVDFYLNNGTVLFGHNNPVITHSIKGAISVDTESVFFNKFYYKTVRIFRSFVDFNNIAFFSSFNMAIVELLHFLKVEKLAVNSKYLFLLIERWFPSVKIEMLRKGRQYDLILFEPLDFDGNLSIFPIDDYYSRFKVSVENRCSFRVKEGFVQDLKNIDFIVAGNVVANGMDCAVVLSKDKIRGEILPSYKIMAIQTTLKYFFRHKFIDYPNLNFSFLKYQRGSIFKIDKRIDLEKLLPYGVFFSGDVGFLSSQHTEHDVKRLKKAIEANSFN